MKAPRDFVTFEYVMPDGVNDKAEHARELLEIGGRRTLQIQPDTFNLFPHSGYERSSAENIRIFRDILQQASFVVTVGAKRAATT